MAAIFAISDADAINLVDAIVIGGVLADYLTWLARSLITLPSNVWHGCYDGLVNILFGWFLFHFTNIELPTGGQSIAAAFLSFMVVMGIKVVSYVADFFKEIYEEE